MNSIKAAFIWGNAGIAQLVEQLICNQQVVGSNPTAGSAPGWVFLVGGQLCNWRCGSLSLSMDRYPKSPNEMTRGMMYFPRMLDKIRLYGSGELHEDYHK